jgi:predicted kinase
MDPHYVSATKPVLVLMKGHPGAGKSTLARCLSESTKWPLIDKDDCRDALRDVQDSAATVDCNAIAYSIMFQVAATQLSLGISTIVDCPLARVDLYERATAIAAQVGPHLRPLLALTNHLAQHLKARSCAPEPSTPAASPTLPRTFQSAHTTVRTCHPGAATE